MFIVMMLLCLFRCGAQLLEDEVDSCYSQKPIKILYILDTSASIDDTELDQAKNFIEASYRDGVPPGAESSLLAFSSQNVFKWRFSDNVNTVDDFSTRLEYERVLNHHTHTKNAIAAGLIELKGSADEDDFTAIVLLTDGKPTDEYSPCNGLLTENAVDDIKGDIQSLENFMFFVVMVRETDTSQVACLAKDENNIFEAGSFAELTRMKESFNDQVCDMVGTGFVDVDTKVLGVQSSEGFIAFKNALLQTIVDSVPHVRIEPETIHLKTKDTEKISRITFKFDVTGGSGLNSESLTTALQEACNDNTRCLFLQTVPCLGTNEYNMFEVTSSCDSTIPRREMDPEGHAIPTRAKCEEVMDPWAQKKGFTWGSAGSWPKEPRGCFVDEKKVKWNDIGDPLEPYTDDVEKTDKSPICMCTRKPKAVTFNVKKLEVGSRRRRMQQTTELPHETYVVSFNISGDYNNKTITSISNTLEWLQNDLQYYIAEYARNEWNTELLYFHFGPEFVLQMGLTIHGMRIYGDGSDSLDRIEDTMATFGTAAIELDELSSYPGVSNTPHVGDVSMVFSGRSVFMTYSFQTYDTQCDLGPSENITDSCGIAIHSGTSCDDYMQVGDHFFNTAVDPWADTAYTGSQGDFVVEYGHDWEHTEGKVLVIYDYFGNPMTCDAIEVRVVEPSFAPSLQPSSSSPSLTPSANPTAGGEELMFGFTHMEISTAAFLLSAAAFLCLSCFACLYAAKWCLHAATSCCSSGNKKPQKRGPPEQIL